MFGFLWRKDDFDPIIFPEGQRGLDNHWGEDSSATRMIEFQGSLVGSCIVSFEDRPQLIRGPWHTSQLGAPGSWSCASVASFALA